MPYESAHRYDKPLTKPLNKLNFSTTSENARGKVRIGGGVTFLGLVSFEASRCLSPHHTPDEA